MALGWRGQYNRYKGYFLDILNLYRQRPDLRAFIEVVLSISTVAIFLIFALKPTALTIISLVKEINGKKETIAGLDQKISDLQKAQSAYIQSRNLISNVDTAIATKPLPEAVSKQVIGLSAKNSVTILGLSIGQTTLIGKDVSTKKSSGSSPLPGGAREMPISISVQGDYLNLFNFIKDLENLRIASKIDLVGINSSEKDSKSVIVALISARIPFLGE
jgi:Tfp pilus assembly protein PilO